MGLVWEAYYCCDMELLNEVEPDLREKVEEIEQIYVEYYWLNKYIYI